MPQKQFSRGDGTWIESGSQFAGKDHLAIRMSYLKFGHMVGHAHTRIDPEEDRVRRFERYGFATQAHWSDRRNVDIAEC
jgi:hypothetical protein